MQTFASNPVDDMADRYTAMLESALLARALADTGALPDERRKQLLRQWLHGTFNPSADGCTTIGEGRGLLAWQPEDSGYRLVWLAPSGLACPLARIYAQDDGSWAVLVVAGVRDDPAEAMATAEWGVSRLTA